MVVIAVYKIGRFTYRPANISLHPTPQKNTQEETSDVIKNIENVRVLL